jgi:hypothetical protein
MAQLHILGASGSNLAQAAVCLFTIFSLTFGVPREKLHTSQLGIHSSQML